MGYLNDDETAMLGALSGDGRLTDAEKALLRKIAVHEGEAVYSASYTKDMICGYIMVGLESEDVPVDPDMLERKLGDCPEFWRDLTDCLMDYEEYPVADYAADDAWQVFRRYFEVEGGKVYRK